VKVGFAASRAQAQDEVVLMAQPLCAEAAAESTRGNMPTKRMPTFKKKAADVKRLPTTNVYRPN
jgi:hypothetical protein